MSTEESADKKHAFKLPIKSPDHLAAFILHAFGIVVPSTKVCPDHVSPWEAFCAGYFANESINVWEGSRGLSGKTFTLSLLSLVEALTLKADVNLLGGSGEQSERILEAMALFWGKKTAPRYLLKSAPAKRHTKLKWGNTIKALMASTRSARGPHPQRLNLDEIDEMDIKIWDAALGQTMERNLRGFHVKPGLVASSTHQYSDRTMTEVKKRAAERGWPVYKWCYKETRAPHGWLSESEIVRKKNEVSAQMWLNEYELGEPSPEGRAINQDAVKIMFDRRLGYYKGDVGQYIEIEEWENDGVYATGGDWAKTKDWCIFITLRIDCNPFRLVAFERVGRRPWPEMIKRFDFQRKRFQSVAAHDATGIGNVIHDYLDVDGAIPIILSGATRKEVLSDYVVGIEHQGVEAPFIEWMEREHRLVTTADLYVANVGHLPDTISAGAAAFHAAKFAGYAFWF